MRKSVRTTKVITRETAFVSRFRIEKALENLSKAVRVITECAFRVILVFRIYSAFSLEKEYAGVDTSDSLFVE